MTKFVYTNIIYEVFGNEPYLLIRGREQVTGKRIDIQVKGFEPCFFVKDIDISKDLKADERVVNITKHPTVKRSIYGDPVSLVKTHVPKEVSSWDEKDGLRDTILKECETFQSDIRFQLNYLIWSNIYSGITVNAPNRISNGIPVYDWKDVKPYTDIDTKIKILNIDIETYYHKNDGKDISNYEQEVTAISIKTTGSDKCATYLFNPKKPKSLTEKTELEGINKRKYTWFKFHFLNESVMLEKFLSDLQSIDPDLITGWNVNFDISYLIWRMDKLELDYAGFSPYRDFTYRAVSVDKNGVPRIKGRAVVDEMMAYYDHTIFDGELKSYSLDFVSHHELKTGKVKYTGTTGELMDRDEDKLAEYNVWDMLLVEWIAEVKELWDYKEYVRRQMGLPLDECGSMSTPIHTLLVRRSMLKGMAFANRNFDEKTKFKGAVVFPAIYGLYNAMASLDFKSLYPIIMIMWNLSLETIIRKPSKYPREYLKKCIRTPPTDISPEGLYIKPKSEQVGFLCEILTEFIQERDKAKAKALKYRDMHGKGDSRTKAAEQAQKFEKAKTNSVYGELKKYILALGDAVTAIARGAIQHASDLAESEELSKELIKMFEASI